MIRIFTQLIRISRSGVEELRSMKSIFLSIQKQIESIGKQQQSDKEKDNEPNPPIISVLTTPSAIKVDAKTREDISIWQRIFEIVEAVGVIAVIVYAVLTYHMWIQMIRSTNASEQTSTSAYHQAILSGKVLSATVDNFRKERRPWIKVNASDLNFTFHGQVNTPYMLVYIANAGNTPAKKIHLMFKLELVENGKSPEFIHRPETPTQPVHQGKKIAVANGEYQIMFSGEDSKQYPLEVPFLSENAKPGVTSPRQITDPEWQEFRTGKAYFALHGWVLYTDTFSYNYWTQYCTWAGPGQGFLYTAEKCTAYNDTDNN